MTLYGDWGKLKRLFAKDTLKRAKEKALKKTLAYFQGQIKKNIVSSGILAGKPFAANSERTVKKKKSSKPLVNTGDMVGSVVPLYINDVTGFVGLKRGKRHTSMKDVADIGWINEKGVITQWGQVIPARPFVSPVLKKFAGKGNEIYNKAFVEKLAK